MYIDSITVSPHFSDTSAMRDYTRNIHKTDPICSGHVWIDWTASSYEMMQFIYSDLKKKI